MAKKNTQSDTADPKDGSKSLLNRIFLRQAKRLVRKPWTLLQLVNRSLDYFRKFDSIREFTQEVREQFERISRLVVAYAKGEYRGIAIGNIVLSVAVLLYFLSPIDFIPDFLVGGLLDDLALFTWLYNTFDKEMERFLEWEDAQKTVLALDANPAPKTLPKQPNTTEDKA